MQTPPKPSNESERLRELYSLQILDSENDKLYDDIVFIASTIMQTPIALISLVDEDRLWIKSEVGLGVKEVPRDISFCAHAILTPHESFIINDASKDKRFADSPLVLGEPKIKFYFGVPLIMSNNYAIGTICTVDVVPREDPSKAQIESLTALSRVIIYQLEVRELIINAYQKIEKFSTKSSLDIRIASSFREIMSKSNMLLEHIKNIKNKI